jgi:acetyl-CoA carboxylase biotin carboxyl carrier protein
MELARLKALIDMVSQSKVAELEITEGGVRVLIRKQPARAERLPPPTETAARKAPTPAPRIQSEPNPEAHAVTSPMFGIFHRAPSPDAPPHVQVGSQVSVGDTLCLVEAMKSFNAVTADRAGTVAAIPVENGQEVEPGQVLILIGA